MRVDVFACILLPVRAVGPLNAKWSDGPLPVDLKFGGDTGRSGGSTRADTAARSTYFAARVVDTLYAAHTDRTRGRWHTIECDQTPLHGAIVEAWECLLVESGDGFSRGYAIAHIQLGAEPLALLTAVTRQVGNARRWLDRVAPPGFEILSGEQVRLVSHLIYDGEMLPEPTDDAVVLDRMRGWAALDRWLWFLGTGVDVESFTPDPEQPRPGTVVPLSADWRALALRSGLAFAAITPRARGPHDLLRAYARSLHVDGFLLCQLQADGAHALADEIGQTQVETLTVESAMALEGRLLSLRADLWWRHVSGRGGQVDEIVRALQSEKQLPELFTQLVEELTDVGRFIQLRQALADEGRDRQLSQVVSVASAAFVTPSIFLAAVALVPDPSKSMLLGFWLSSVVLAGVTWLGIRHWMRKALSSGEAGL